MVAKATARMPCAHGGDGKARPQAQNETQRNKIKFCRHAGLKSEIFGLVKTDGHLYMPAKIYLTIGFGVKRGAFEPCTC